MCKFTTEAITTEGSDKGELRRVCSNPACPIHHPQKQTNRDDGKWKAEQEKHRREEAIANATGLCVLAAISAAIPVRLMNRDQPPNSRKLPNSAARETRSDNQTSFHTSLIRPTGLRL